ncbi:hypothetical protein RF11_12925 [Thelohanellus kitauei]|uniref:Uncharacterized protein n=1 Tax=Thelohanellus kitauei TaxID=669202 RepID=A0A0C2MI95_THEKT|nr:hypothetical protein RF11_12925 [Thelohanellus kitauei]
MSSYSPVELPDDAGDSRTHEEVSYSRNLMSQHSYFGHSFSHQLKQASSALGQQLVAKPQQLTFVLRVVETNEGTQAHPKNQGACPSNLTASGRASGYSYSQFCVKHSRRAYFEGTGHLLDSEKQIYHSMGLTL